MKKLVSLLFHRVVLVAVFILIQIAVLLVMILLTIPALVRGKLSRVQGVAQLCIYSAFCAVQFTM